MPQHQRLAHSLLLSATAAAVCLAGLEGSVRLTVGQPWAERLPLVRVQPDPQLGWRMLPGDVHYTYQHRVRLNALGFRGPEVAPKQPGEFRILAIGDSHIYGQGIGDGRLLTDRLREELEWRDSARPISVVNMGVRGYSLNQEVGLLRRMAPVLEPDHVILFFYLNDFEPVDVEAQYRRFQHLSWYTFDLSGTPEGKRLERWRQRQWLRNSALVMWMHDRYVALRSRNAWERRILEGRVDKSLDTVHAQAADHLLDIAALATRYRFSVSVAVIPVAAQLAHDFPRERYQTAVRDLARRAGLGFIDLLPGMKAKYGRSYTLPVIPYDGHYEAHALGEMAVLTARHLRREVAGLRTVLASG